MSSIGHMYYYRHSIQFALFICHLCNTTLVVGQAMDVLSSYNLKSKDNFYYILLKTVYDIQVERKGKTNVDSDMYNVPDIGSGRKNRYSPSYSKPYQNEQVESICSKLIDMITQYNDLMKNASTTEDRLNVVHSLQSQLDTILFGLSDVKCQLLVQLLSMFGILSLEFYVNTPMHISGGCGIFINENVNLNLTNQTQLLKWNAEEVEALQQVYGDDYTPSIFENSTCLISRSQKRYDVFMEMKWPSKDILSPRKSSFTDKNVFQLFFRYNSNTCALECFDGNETHIFLILETKQNLETIVSWKYNKDGSINQRYRMQFNEQCNDLYDYIN